MNHLNAFITSLLQDKNYLEGKRKILEAVANQQKKIDKVCPADPSLSIPYKELVETFSQYRSMPLWYSYIGTGLGHGSLVQLADGSVKYDFISGIGSYWGHSDLNLIDVCLDAACQNTLMQGNLQQNLDALQLCELLINTSGLDHCILTTSGAMAGENSLKLIFQKKFPAKRLLTFKHCFAGRTIFLSNINDKAAYRMGLPQTAFVDYVPFYDEKEPEKSLEKSLNAIKEYITRYPQDHSCMCFELIQGEGGYYTGTKQYFLSLMEFLKAKKVAIWVDEVQTFGRTDHLFAFQHFGLREYVDVVSIGKLTQVCATLFRKEFQPSPGLISQTFTSSTSAIHSAFFIINSLLSKGYLGPKGKNQKISHYFQEHLKKLSEKYPSQIKGPFGYGLMIAFTPLQGEREKVLKFAQRLFEKGVICFIAGDNPTRIRFLVPIGAIDFKDIDQVIVFIEETLNEARSWT